MSLSMYRRKPGPLETVSLLLLPFAFYAVKGSAFVVQQTAPSNTRLAAVELVFDGDCNIVSDPLPSDVTKDTSSGASVRIQ